MAALQGRDTQGLDAQRNCPTLSGRALNFMSNVDLPKVMPMRTIVPADYIDFVDELKKRVAAARLSAARSVNSELVGLYWDISAAIRQQNSHEKQNGLKGVFMRASWLA
jgi:hypothetical protein